MNLSVLKNDDGSVRREARGRRPRHVPSCPSSRWCRGKSRNGKVIYCSLPRVLHSVSPRLGNSIQCLVGITSVLYANAFDTVSATSDYSIRALLQARNNEIGRFDRAAWIAFRLRWWFNH